MPDFLGIGMPRSGTTWLHEVLSEHPEVYVPRARKELGFFGNYYDKGFDWYQSFFPDEARARGYRAIGEITPTYATQPQALERIASCPEVRVVIVMLRDPLPRFRSQYVHRCRARGHDGQLESFLAENRDVLEASRYSRVVPTVRERLGDRRLAFVIYERATTDFDYFRSEISSALGVDPNLFGRASWARVVHASRATASTKAASHLARLKRLLRRAELDWLVNAAVSIGARRLYGRQVSNQGLATPHLRGPVWEEIQADLLAERPRLERLLGMAIPEWSSPEQARAKIATGPQAVLT